MSWRMQNHHEQDSLHVNVTCLYYSSPQSTQLLPSYLSGYSVTKSLPILCDPMHSSTPGLPVLHHLPEPVQTHGHPVSDAIQPLILCRPLLLPLSIIPSIRVFSNESALRIMWPKYWSFSFNISLSNEHQDWSPLGWTGWISLLSKGLSRVFSNTTAQKASILPRSAFFIVQLSHPYMTTGKTIALIRWTFGKVMSLLFSMLSRLVIDFLPRSMNILAIVNSAAVK